MDESLQGCWDSMVEWAREFDDSNRDNERSWVPPILGALVTAVQATELTRLYPFKSHATFRLCTGPRCWLGDVRIAPGYISLDPAGLYNVWSGQPLDPSSTTLVSTTADPRQAATELERLLTAWG